MCEPAIDREYRMTDEFVDPEGQTFTASIQNAEAGLLGYALEVDLPAPEVSPGGTGSQGSGTVHRFSRVQHRVRVLLPVGTHVNSCLKTDSHGARYEFLKTPLLDDRGRARTDDQGRPLFTGVEFHPAVDEGLPDEAWIYLVDNERGDEDPTLGRIFDPAILAFVDRVPGPAIPRIDLPASPALAGAAGC